MYADCKKLPGNIVSGGSSGLAAHTLGQLDVEIHKHLNYLAEFTKVTFEALDMRPS